MQTGLIVVRMMNVVEDIGRFDVFESGEALTYVEYSGISRPE